MCQQGLQLAKTIREMERIQDRAEIENMEVEIAKEEKQQELNLQPLKFEVEKKKLQLESAKYQVELDKLEHPPPPPAPPPAKTPDEIAKEKAEKAVIQVKTEAALRQQEADILKQYPEEHHKAVRSYFRQTIEHMREEL